MMDRLRWLWWLFAIAKIHIGIYKVPNCEDHKFFSVYYDIWAGYSIWVGRINIAIV